LNTCPLCGKSDLRRFPIHYTLAEKRFDARECTSCGFIFLLPRPSTDELRLMYSDEYFLHDGADFGAHSMTDYETAAVRGSVKFPVILGHIKRYKRDGDFFEVGCGMGYFLDFARRHGYRVSGIEHAGLGTNICRERFGLDVTTSSFEGYPERAEAYDVVFFGDVLEHIVEPLEMLKKAYRMLRAGGIAAVEVPSTFNSIAGRVAASAYRVLGRDKKMPLPPYHVNEFVPRTLRAILLGAGFRRADIIQRAKTPGTISLRGSFFEKSAKKTLQYPNYIITNSLGLLGDRLLGIGVK